MGAGGGGRQLHWPGCRVWGRACVRERVARPIARGSEAAHTAYSLAQLVQRPHTPSASRVGWAQMAMAIYSHIQPKGMYRYVQQQPLQCLTRAVRAHRHAGTAASAAWAARRTSSTAPPATAATRSRCGTSTSASRCAPRRPASAAGQRQGSARARVCVCVGGGAQWRCRAAAAERLSLPVSVCS